MDQRIQSTASRLRIWNAVGTSICGELNPWIETDSNPNGDSENELPGRTSLRLAGCVVHQSRTRERQPRDRVGLGGKILASCLHIINIFRHKLGKSRIVSYIFRLKPSTLYMSYSSNWLLTIYQLFERD